METKTSLVNAKENKDSPRLLYPTLKKVDSKYNDNWMKDWMEQADNYKNNKEALKLISNDIDGFLHYADKIEGKYV